MSERSRIARNIPAQRAAALSRQQQVFADAPSQALPLDVAAGLSMTQATASQINELPAPEAVNLEAVFEEEDAIASF